MGPSPVKIVRILGRLNIGGPSIHVVLLSEGLNNSVFRTVLVTGTVGKSEGDMFYFARMHGVSPFVVPELGREISWRDDLVALWKLYKILVKERPHIVHTHTAKAGTLGRIAALLARVPIRIHTFHGHVFDGYFGFFKTKVFVLVERALALFTTKIVVISNTQLFDLSNRYRIAPRDKFVVMSLGLDLVPLLDNRDENGKFGLDLRANDMTIGFVGRLVPIKNPSMAIRVFERLVHNGKIESPARLLVIGDGELKPDLQKQVDQAGLEDRVAFTGWQPDHSNLYARLNLVILTSLNEGTPVALIEAMASGIPFIATRVGGLPDLMVGPEEVIRSASGAPLFSLFANGVLVAPGDIEGFTAAIEFLLQDKERMRQMGLEGREFVKERFSKERLIEDVRTLYQDCLRRYIRPACRQNSLAPEEMHPPDSSKASA